MRGPSSKGAFRFSSVGLLCLIPGLLLVAPTPGDAQAGTEVSGDGECDVPSHQGLVMTTFSSTGGENRMLDFKYPVIRCPGGVQIRADSALMYESTNYTQLFGNVVFSDQDSRLAADRAQYFSDQRRLVAQENAVLTDLAEGSVIRGDNITLIRAGPQQAEDFLLVRGRRPHATLYPSIRPDTTAAVPDTLAAVPDTLAAVPDTLAAVQDSAAVPDSVTVPPDTVAGPPEALVTDTTAVQPDSAQIELVRIPPPEEDLPEVIGPQPEPQVERVPYEIDASQFTLEGSRFFRAIGSVVVTRDSLRAEADSLEYDHDEAFLFLSQNATVENAGTDLAAQNIRLAIPQDEIREALATGEAVLLGEDLRLLAPIITMFFTEGQMERLVAVRDAVADSAYAEMDEEAKERQRMQRGPPPMAAQELGFSEFPRRPYALAQDFVLEGDSVEVIAPSEVLEEVRAMGGARGESAGRDTLNSEETPELISKDWLEGNTIVAFFSSGGDTLVAVDPESPEEEVAPVVEPPPVADPAGGTPADTTGTDYVMERLLAQGNARSMYRMAPSDSTLAAEGGHFAIHYVVGDEITILLNAAGEAEKMEVTGQTRGIHLEPTGVEPPVADSLSLPDTVVVPDTLVVPDTMVVPDTSGVARGGRRVIGGRKG